MPLASVLLCLITGEIAVRVYHLLRFDISVIDGRPRHQSSNRFSSITLDDRLGWRATENYRFEGTKRSSDGAEYPVRVSQDANGFRMFGDAFSGKPKIFVIGDSFTQAVDASDDKTYYAVIKQSLDIEVFAYGAGGYGSLQEYMIFDRYFDVIKPDLVLWQYSTNDFVNNSPELEAASRINNNGMVRPYLHNNQIQYVLPQKHAKEIRLFSLRYCRLCYITLSRLDKLRAAQSLHTVERETFAGGPSHSMFLHSLQVTDKIMEMVRRRAGSTPIVAFIVGTGFPCGPEYEEGLKEISSRHNIILLDGVERAVLTAEKAAATVRAADGSHWNELGHRIAGEAIVQALRSAGVLGSR
ncbi:MAG: SGNH/GDSL hydrolase family protein [Thermodesulfobacteriota bacterium]